MKARSVYDVDVMTSERQLPEGRLGRLRRLAGLGAKTGASLLLHRDGGAWAAEQAAEVLGTLRGLAAKVGQMASYVDGIVPDSHRDAYETALRGLRAAAPTSSPQQIRNVVEEELKAPIDKLFVEWSDAPLASASIGQVHTARLSDGRQVAVKVQHPGIASAIESDLQNAGIIQGLVGTVGPKHLNSRAVYDEIKRRFQEELDYGLEAERQMYFFRLHAGDAEIDIPEVIPERSGKRVLCTLLKSGVSLEEAATAPIEMRRRYAETLWRFVFKSNLVGGMFNADPHPGNYMFRPDGSVVFLDFGCVQPIVGEHLQEARSAHRAALSGDHAAFRACITRLLRTSGGAYEEAMLEFLTGCFAPLFRSPFRATREYVKGLVEKAVDMKRVIMSKDSGYVPPREGLVFMNRLQFGFYSVLSRLEVEADYAAVERRFFAESGI
jgi:predicted unusual protein kinase regulating ubiquinone biosynthesis (AarF/ABC1/UbiB family)